MTSGLFTVSMPAAHADSGLLRDGPAGQTDCFFAGPENALVRSIVRVVDGQLSAGNPLVLYGPSGVGKSSLALALAARRRDGFDLDSTVLTSGADLARSLADAVETDSVADHRARHHRCDLLLIDDLHRLSNKPAAQQFLISALDSLLRRGSLVIVTLPQSPQATPGLAPQLVSRLLGGLVVRLALPGPLARRELVRQTATRTNLNLTADQINRLADGGESATDHYLSATKIRMLVLRLAADAEIGPQPQANNEAAPTGRDPKHHKALSRRITALVAKHFGLPAGELRSKSRRQAVADARGLAMYLVRRLTTISYADVGRLFGGRDHTTVLHACRKINTQIDRDACLRRTADELALQVGAEGLV